MFKQGLDIRVGQSLSMTPQLQQAIRLLQLSSIELQEEIQQALEENPLLQQEEEYPASPDNAEQASDSSEASMDTESDYNAPETSMDTEIPNDINADTDWGDVYDMGSGSSQNAESPDSQSFLESQSGGSQSLQDYLLWQVQMSALSATDQHIATAIIQNLDEKGYLCESLEHIHTSLNAELPDDEFIELNEIAAVLTYIQSLDPAGIAARDLQECLLIQLRKIQPETPLLLKTIKLLEKYPALLEKRDYKEIKKRLRWKQEDLEEAISLLRGLQPKPGLLFADIQNDYVTPDIFVHKLKGEWVVSLNQSINTQLSINSFYADMIGKSANKENDQYLKEHLQQARWLIRSLDSRNNTIMSVAKVIVERQRAFMQYGEQAMKPLILRDIAEELEMHESTISRVTTNKYMHTPRGVFELKYFFSSQVATSTGASSSTAIRAMIKQLIAEEDAAAPLSDSKLTQLLKAQGISVARRTVTKYRESLSLPSSHERKTLVIS